jgi:DnaJ-class molecular chaperone
MLQRPNLLSQDGTFVFAGMRNPVKKVPVVQDRYFALRHPLSDIIEFGHVARSLWCSGPGWSLLLIAVQPRGRFSQSRVDSDGTAMSDNPYDVLGVSKNASSDEIKKAYRKIARESHPDLHPGDTAAEARFKAAGAAFDLLKDPETRARFDRGEIDASGHESPRERPFYRDFAEDPENPYRRGPRYEGFGDEADIFAEFLRRQARQEGDGVGNRAFRTRGADAHYALEVPFLDAATGGAMRITLPGGNDLEVKIPKGVADGQTLRLRGKGGPGHGGGATGGCVCDHFSRAASAVLARGRRHRDDPADHAR